MTDSDLPSQETPLVRQLRQSLGMLQVAFDATSEAMLIIDEHRLVHWANQASAELLVQGVPIQVVNCMLGSLFELDILESRGSEARRLLDPEFVADQCRRGSLPCDAWRWKPIPHSTAEMASC